VNREAKLVFAAAFAVLLSLLALAVVLDGARPPSTRFTATVPIAVAIALMIWATHVRRQLHRRRGPASRLHDEDDDRRADAR
jgi:hypothetical protein